MIKIYKTNDSYLIVVENETTPLSTEEVFNTLKNHFNNVEILQPYKSADGVIFYPQDQIVFTSSVEIEEVERLIKKRFKNTRIILNSYNQIENYVAFKVYTMKGVSYVRFLSYPYGVNFGKRVICTNGLFVVEKSNTDAANFFKKKLSK